MRVEEGVRELEEDEILGLRRIWRDVFKDEEFVTEKFHELYLRQGNVLVIKDGEEIVAAGYLLPYGRYRNGGEEYNCAMIYAVAAQPEHRGKGYGTAVIRGLIEKSGCAGYPIVMVCPASESLFEYYAGIGFRNEFYIRERRYKAGEIVEGRGRAAIVSEQEYLIARRRMLEGRAHFEPDVRAVRYQNLLSKHSDGGLVTMNMPDGKVSCAVVEKRTEGEVLIKELISELGCEEQSLSLLAGLFNGREYIMRTPVWSMKESGKRRFGMAVSEEWIKDEVLSDTAWFGFAFD